MDIHAFAHTYLNLLRDGNALELTRLFSKDGTVASPVYGLVPANDFYNILFADTKTSKLTLDGVFHEEASNRVIVLFDYDWTLKNGKKVLFKVSDVFEFNSQEKVTKLTIIYDAVVSRALVQDL